MPNRKAAHDIAENELLGRRIVISETRSNGSNGDMELRVDDFYESREGADLSVDCLGNPNPVSGRLGALTLLADRDASKRNPRLSFSGWAAIQHKDLRFRGWSARVSAAPTTEDDGRIENQWHANVSREEFRTKAQAYAFAVTLRDVFERKGRRVAPVRA